MYSLDASNLSNGFESLMYVVLFFAIMWGIMAVILEKPRWKIEQVKLRKERARIDMKWYKGRKDKIKEYENALKDFEYYDGLLNSKTNWFKLKI